MVLQAWYFLTPIIYPVTELSPEHLWKLWLNPAYPFFEIFHSIIAFGKWPDLTTCCIAAGIAVVTLGIGYAVFKSQENKLVFRL